MKVGELITELGKHHSDAQVNVYIGGPNAEELLKTEDGALEYALYTIFGVGNWGESTDLVGTKNDLITINIGEMVGNG